MFPSPFPEFISFHCRQHSAEPEYPPHLREAADILEAASETRKLQFLSGRSCARRALARFGLENVPIPRKKNSREPLWPAGILGSITHAGDWAAAAVARCEDAAGIGIDLEQLDRKIDFNIRRHVCLAMESEWLESLSADDSLRSLKMIFSAKESIFKCFFPGSRVYLGFQDAQVSLNEDRTCFEFRLFRDCEPLALRGFQHHGRIQVKDNMLFTSLFIKHI